MPPGDVFIGGKAAFCDTVHDLILYHIVQTFMIPSGCVHIDKFGARAAAPPVTGRDCDLEGVGDVLFPIGALVGHGNRVLPPGQGDLSMIALNGLYH